MVQESKLDEKIKFQIDGYNVLRNDCVRGRSGTAIIVRNNIPIKNHRYFNNKIHSNSINISVNGKWSTFTSAYFPPGLALSFDSFNEFFRLHLGSFIGGDLNG